MAMLPWWIHYPNVNNEIINLDWILQVSNENTDKIENFIGINTIKYADPILWDITSQYEANTIVVDPQTGDAYISTKAVPYGVALSNEGYWTKIYNYASELHVLREQIAADEQLSTTATAPRSVDDLVFVNGLLYRITSPMIAGDSYVEDSNCVKTTINAELARLHNTIVESVALEAQAREDADTALGGRIDNEAQAREDADTALGGRIDGEAQARADADTELGQRITDEATALGQRITDEATARANAIDSSTASMLHSLSDNGIILDNFNIIKVDVIAHDDYINLRDAIIAAGNASVPTILKLQGGTYNMVDLFPPSLYPSGCVVPDNTYLIGQNQRMDVVLTASLNSPDTAYSTINLSYSSGLMNMRIYGHNVRYCVHDDNSADGHNTRIVENVYLHGESLALRWAYGAGIRNGETLILHNVEFYNDNGAFSIHNWVGETLDSYVKLSECKFTQYATGDNPYDIILTAQHYNDDVVTHGDVRVDIINCDASSIQFTSEAYTTNYFYMNCNNPDTLLIGSGIEMTRITMPNLKRIRNISGLSGRGKLVAFTNYNNGGRLFETSYPENFANGITVSDLLDDGTIIVQTGGVAYGYEIGLTPSPGNYLFYDLSADAVTQGPSVDTGDIIIGYALASGMFKLHFK